MRRGKWVPIDKRLVSSLPAGKREYTELEAAFCVTCDYDNGKLASISGYAKQWIWSRKRVASFAKKMGWSLTTSRSKKVSLINIDRNIEGVSIKDSCWNGGASRVASSEQAGGKYSTSSEQVESKLSTGETTRCETEGTSREQARDKSRASLEQVGGKLGSSTIDPDPKPNPDPLLTPVEKKKKGVAKKVNGYSEKFLAFWKEYPKKQGKAAAWKDWQKMKLDIIYDQIMKSLADHKRWDGWTKDGGKYIPMASSWVHQKRWEDEVFSPAGGTTRHQQQPRNMTEARAMQNQAVARMLLERRNNRKNGEPDNNDNRGTSLLVEPTVSGNVPDPRRN